MSLEDDANGTQSTQSVFVAPMHLTSSFRCVLACRCRLSSLQTNFALEVHMRVSFRVEQLKAALTYLIQYRCHTVSLGNYIYMHS